MKGAGCSAAARHVGKEVGCAGIPRTAGGPLEHSGYGGRQVAWGDGSCEPAEAGDVVRCGSFVPGIRDEGVEEPAEQGVARRGELNQLEPNIAMHHACGVRYRERAADLFDKREGCRDVELGRAVLLPDVLVDNIGTRCISPIIRKR